MAEPTREPLVPRLTPGKAATFAASVTGIASVMGWATGRTLVAAVNLLWTILVIVLFFALRRFNP
jgi:hypothetical protein